MRFTWFEVSSYKVFRRGKNITLYTTGKFDKIVVDM